MDNTDPIENVKTFKRWKIEYNPHLAEPDMAKHFAGPYSVELEASCVKGDMFTDKEAARTVEKVEVSRYFATVEQALEWANSEREKMLTYDEMMESLGYQIDAHRESVSRKKSS